MIKATGQDAHGQPVLFLGLTGENMTRLMADEPIRPWTYRPFLVDGSALTPVVVIEESVVRRIITQEDGEVIVDDTVNDEPREHR